MRRRRPRLHELRPLLGFERPGLNLTERRLTAALTIDDLRRLANRWTLRAAFDYADGAAEGETSFARARPAFQVIGSRLAPAATSDARPGYRPSAYPGRASS